jgi:DNA-binding beta-propeller fold protein YncE
VVVEQLGFLVRRAANGHTLKGVPQHGIAATPDRADNFDNTVRVFTADGKLLQTLGKKNEPSATGSKAWSTPVQHAAGPFNMVTNVALAPNGNLYVADGYGNAQAHVFSPSGELLFSWGEFGSGPGQFKLPHATAVDRRGTVYVADRENSRIQVFKGDGTFVTA